MNIDEVDFVDQQTHSAAFMHLRTVDTGGIAIAFAVAEKGDLDVPVSVEDARRLGERLVAAANNVEGGLESGIYSSTERAISDAVDHLPSGTSSPTLGEYPSTPVRRAKLCQWLVRCATAIERSASKAAAEAGASECMRPTILFASSRISRDIEVEPLAVHAGQTLVGCQQPIRHFTTQGH